MRYLIQEMGQTVRSAIQSWSMTARLSVLIAVGAAALTISTYYQH